MDAPARGIRTFAQVFQYLVDDQGWPLELPDLEDDDLTAVTYDWDPAELGIPAERLKDFKRLQQMRPFDREPARGVPRSLKSQRSRKVADEGL